MSDPYHPTLRLRLRRQAGNVRYLYRKFFRGDEEAGFILAERATQILSPSYLFSDYGRIWLEDEAFLAYYRQHVAMQDSRYPNYHSADRKFMLKGLLPFALRAEGDLAECGVYQGASTRLIASAAEGTGRTIHLFDSFEGLSRPDPRLDGGHWRAGDLEAPRERVEKALAGYEVEFDVHQGWIPDCFAGLDSTAFCFSHIDVDLYEPTRDALEYFYEHTTDRGIILFDDYGFTTCPGAQMAVDEFMATKPEPLVHVPTGQALLIRERR